MMTRKAVKIPGSDNEARYYLPVGSNILINDGDYLEAGDVVAKIPRETTKTSTSSPRAST